MPLPKVDPVKEKFKHIGLALGETVSTTKTDSVCKFIRFTTQTYHFLPVNVLH